MRDPGTKRDDDVLWSQDQLMSLAVELMGDCREYQVAYDENENRKMNRQILT